MTATRPQQISLNLNPNPVKIDQTPVLKGLQRIRWGITNPPMEQGETEMAAKKKVIARKVKKKTKTTRKVSEKPKKVSKTAKKVPEKAAPLIGEELTEKLLKAAEKRNISVEALIRNKLRNIL